MIRINILFNKKFAYFTEVFSKRLVTFLTYFGKLSKKESKFVNRENGHKHLDLSQIIKRLLIETFFI